MLYVYPKSQIARARHQTYISIQIPYYTNVRKLFDYYDMFYSINFAMYNVSFEMLSYYVVVWKASTLPLNCGKVFYILWVISCME